MNSRAAAVDRELWELVPRVTSRRPAKIIAFELKVPPRTVKGWQSGDHQPRLAHFVALADLFPELREKGLEWFAAALDLDPADTARLFAEMQRLLLRGRPK